MDIYSIFTLIGGLAFFLYGMTIMSQGLEKIAGGKLDFKSNLIIKIKCFLTVKEQTICK